MDFAGTYDVVAGFLTAAGFRCAVVGGVALAAYGNPHMTLDLDLVTDADAQDALVAFLESRGYRTLHRSAGYSNHLHADRAWGRVDLIYVRGTTADRVFAGTRAMAGPAGSLIAVPRPEHLVAMKVHAMKNAPERQWQELVDIAFLMGLDEVDLEEVRGYFERADLLERWNELRRT